MRAVDTNVLIYSFFADSPFHATAKATVDALAVSPAPWAIPWPCIHEFYAVVTNPKIFRDASLALAARAQIADWMRSPTLQLLSEASDHWPTLNRLIEQSSLVGPAVHDARIAAICLSYRVDELLTLDRDFSRFPHLTVVSILDSAG